MGKGIERTACHMAAGGMAGGWHTVQQYVDVANLNTYSIRNGQSLSQSVTYWYGQTHEYACSGDCSGDEVNQVIKAASPLQVCAVIDLRVIL